MRQPNSHYHARGERIPLVADDEHVGVDVVRASDSLGEGTFAALSADGVELRDGLILVEHDQLDRGDEDRLDRAGALVPVYRDPGGALVLVLPEVRVEVDSESEARSVHRLLEAIGSAVEVVHDRGGRITLRPSSGRGDDALDLANRVYEIAKPAMAQPKLLRITERFSA